MPCVVRAEVLGAPVVSVAADPELGLVLTQDGTLRAVDETDVRWTSRPLEGSPRGLRRSGDLAIVDGLGEVAVVDVRSGQRLWARRLDDPTCCATLVTPSLLRDPTGIIRRLDPRSGTTLWDHPGSGARVVDGGEVVVLDGPHRSQAGRTAILGLDSATGEVRWRADGRARSPDGAAPSGGLIVEWPGGVGVVEAGTGSVRWERALPGRLDAVVVDDVLAVIEGHAAPGGITALRLIAVELSDGTIRWSRDLSTYQIGHFVRPAPGSVALVAPSEGALLVVDVVDGTTLVERAVMAEAVWPRAGGRQAGTAIERGAVLALLDRDGDEVLTVPADGGAVVWDPRGPNDLVVIDRGALLWIDHP